MAARTTLHIDEDLLARLRRFVPQRRLSRFVNETLSEKLASLERREIEPAMKAGYLAARDDRAEIDEDWSVVDTEAWPR